MNPRRLQRDVYKMLAEGPSPGWRSGGSQPLSGTLVYRYVENAYPYIAGHGPCIREEVSAGAGVPAFPYPIVTRRIRYYIAYGSDGVNAMAANSIPATELWLPYCMPGSASPTAVPLTGWIASRPTMRYTALSTQDAAIPYWDQLRLMASFAYLVYPIKDPWPIPVGTAVPGVINTVYEANGPSIINPATGLVDNFVGCLVVGQVGEDGPADANPMPGALTRLFQTFKSNIGTDETMMGFFAPNVVIAAIAGQRAHVNMWRIPLTAFNSPHYGLCVIPISIGDMMAAGLYIPGVSVWNNAPDAAIATGGDMRSWELETAAYGGLLIDQASETGQIPFQTDSVASRSIYSSAYLYQDKVLRAENIQ